MQDMGRIWKNDVNTMILRDPLRYTRGSASVTLNQPVTRAVKLVQPKDSFLDRSNSEKLQRKHLWRKALHLWRWDRLLLRRVAGPWPWLTTDDVKIYENIILTNCLGKKTGWQVSEKLDYCNERIRRMIYERKSSTRWLLVWEVLRRH